MTITKRPNRPKWAKALAASEWKHLCEGSNTLNPRLRDLKIDSDLCAECRRILAKVNPNA